MAIQHCLDSNVLVYAFSKVSRDAAKARIAHEWIARKDWGITVQVLQEFYVNATRSPQNLGHDDALAIVSEIAERRQVIPVDLSLMRHALQLRSRYRISYWDAAVLAGASRLGATVLVSEDLSHNQVYGGVSVQNPFLNA